MSVTVDRVDRRLDVRWSTPNAAGSATFDRVPDTVPEWIGPDEMLDGASSRDAAEIVDALSAWAQSHGTTIGLWRDGGGVEVL